MKESIIAQTLDKILETCDGETRLAIFTVVLKHIAIRPPKAGDFPPTSN